MSGQKHVLVKQEDDMDLREDNGSPCRKKKKKENGSDVEMSDGRKKDHGEKQGPSGPSKLDGGSTSTSPSSQSHPKPEKKWKLTINLLHEIDGYLLRDDVYIYDLIKQDIPSFPAEFTAEKLFSFCNKWYTAGMFHESIKREQYPFIKGDVQKQNSTGIRKNIGNPRVITEDVLEKIVNCIQIPDFAEKISEDVVDINWYDADVGTIAKKPKKCDVFHDNEFLMTSFTKKLLNIIDQCMYDSVMYLRGPSGIGKTVSLTASAEYCKKKEIFLLYFKSPGTIFAESIKQEEFDKKKCISEILKNLVDNNSDVVWAKYITCRDALLTRQSVRAAADTDQAEITLENIQKYVEIAVEENEKLKTVMIVDDLQSLTMQMERVGMSSEEMRINYWAKVVCFGEGWKHGRLLQIIAASQHFPYSILDKAHKQHIEDVAIPMNPHDIYGAKILIGRAMKSKNDNCAYDSKELMRAISRALVLAGCIIRVAKEGVHRPEWGTVASHERD